MRIYDITRPLQDSLAPWPGDTAFSFRQNWCMAAGSTVNVGAITMGVHNGTHADAPRHFIHDAATVEDLPLDTFIGRSVVLDLSARMPPISSITRADLEPALADLARSPRLLLKTTTYVDNSKFPTGIPVLAPGVAEFLGASGVLLLGVDVPSVDALDSKELPNHHALQNAGVLILENLDLSAVSAGVYEIIALPLLVVGGDAAPVRAILREIV